ncbi:AAA domain-containing protein [Azospirillum sp. 11R-A]|uniref:AAA domain-containing protein n=1 Tax=Azospirillum sp. 11R-A TaxID=3111634 RepID=UPI003C21F052
MLITPLKAEGIHHREVAGIGTLSKLLPPHWYGYANLEAATPDITPKEIDVVIVLDDRIVIADIKEWGGQVASDGQKWYQNNKDMGASPVHKINNNARVLSSMINRHLTHMRVKDAVPRIDSCVIMVGAVDFRKIHERERRFVFGIDDFCKMIVDVEKRNRALTNRGVTKPEQALTRKGGPWKARFDQIFCSGNYFKPRNRIFDAYRVVSDVIYRHGEIYAEYDAQETEAADTSGLLRYWDFSKCDPKFYSAEGRAGIIGRERTVLNHLLERSQDMEYALLRQKVTDPEKGLRYWEIFERRRQTQRLSRFLSGEGRTMAKNVRIDLVRTMLANAARMHALDVSHCDIGDHSVWVELPSTVRFSHLFAARIPEGRTIAEDRYSLLAKPVSYPETQAGQVSSPFAKDVFLLGCVAHRLLLGREPDAVQGASAIWDPAADPNGSFASLHPWLEQALEPEVRKRFPNAQAMLDAFNVATKPLQADAETLERLHRFRTHADLIEFMETYPSLKTISSSERGRLYRSVEDGDQLAVKLWNRVNWLEERTDGSRLLAFCQRARDLADLALDGICPIREVSYLLDRVAVVMDWVEGPSLQDLLTAPKDTGPLQGTPAIVDFLLRLIGIVDSLHAQDLAHGDLSPANILCPPRDAAADPGGTSDGGGAVAVTPVLIDVVDLPGPGEGERYTLEYAPREPATAFQRDRCGVLVIAEKLLERCELEPESLAPLAQAFGTCREKEPVFATLAPLADALSALRRPRGNGGLVLTIAIPEDVSDDFLLRPDAGEYHIGVRRQVGERMVTVTGANARLAIHLTREGRPWRVSALALSQDEVGLAQRHRCCGVAATILFQRGMFTDPESVRPLLDLPGVAAELQSRQGGQTAEPVADEETGIEGGLDTDFNLDEEAEAAATGRPPAGSSAVDVAGLWRTLMDVELEDVVEALIDHEVDFSISRKLILIRCRMLHGALEFDADDRVSVKTPNRHGDWVHVGVLDVGATRGNLAAIDSPRYRSFDGSNLFALGNRLRFESRKSIESRNRRERAITRILGGDAAIKNLVDHFTHRDSVWPISVKGAAVPDGKYLEGRYRLNESQVQAFQILWTTGPLGLLQGPPGTGKTTFIAAIIHHALTVGGARRILLASQAHEAVDNAAKGVIDLFAEAGETISLVRVGYKNDLSDTVRPYHKDSLEQRYRDEFRARLKEKIMVVGERLGLRTSYLESFHHLVTAVRPVLKKLGALASEQKHGPRPENDRNRRRSGEQAELEDTVFRLLANIGLSAYEIAAVGYLAVPQVFINNDENAGLEGASQDATGQDAATADDAADSEWVAEALNDDDFPDAEDELQSDIPVRKKQVLDFGEPSTFEILAEALARKQQMPIMPDQLRRLVSAVDLMDDWIGHVGSRHRNFEEFLVGTRQIVCGTCVGLGSLSLGLKSNFDLVIIDEAARCTAGELAVPMQSGKRVILVGDHMQLPPFHVGEYVAETAKRIGIPREEVRRSDFERTFTSPYGKAVGQTLRIQYRMIEPIGRLVSEVFYRDSPLKHGRAAPKVQEGTWPGNLSKAVVWIDTAKAGARAFDTEAKHSKSRQNTAEERAVMRLLRDLDRHEPFQAWLQTNRAADKPLEYPIGIICTYTAQVNLIKKSLLSARISPALRESIRVDTVDSYQGKENLMVILSLVRNNEDGPQGDAGKTIKQGFLSQPHRINVALSRAMDRLVIVGTSKGWPAGSPMAAVASKVRGLQAEGLAAFHDAEER